MAFSDIISRLTREGRQKKNLDNWTIDTNPENSLRENSENRFELWDSLRRTQNSKRDKEAS